jgi:hypothetical protein
MPAGAVAKITLVARNVAAASTRPTRPTGSGDVPDASARTDIATAALRVRVRAPGEGLIALADQSPGAFESARETLERRTGAYAPNGVGGSSRNEARTGTQNASSPKTSAAACGWLFQPSAWSSVRPGEEVSLDLYVRPTTAGVAELPFVICYEPPEPAPPSLRFRVARVATRIEVTPSLEITARVFDAATHPAARVIRVAARNVSGIPPASYGRAVANDGRVNGSSGSSGFPERESRNDEKPASAAAAYTFFVRAVRLLPALERARSSRGANGFSNDAEPLRLSHAVNENENHENHEKQKQKQKRAASDLFLRPLVSGPDGPDAAGGRDAPRRRDRAREGAGHLARRRARGGVREGLRALARRVGRRVVRRGGRVGGARGARQTDARRLRLRRVRDRANPDPKNPKPPKPPRDAVNAFKRV